jgi:hypothetical protein
MPSTHTYAILKISKEAFEEIAGKLMDADYIHCFHRDGAVIDMHGIALQIEGEESKPARPAVFRDRSNSTRERQPIRVVWPKPEERPKVPKPFLVGPEELRRHLVRRQAAARRPVSRIPRDK